MKFNNIIIIKLSLNYLVLSTHFRSVSLDLFEIIYLHKHLWYCLKELKKTTSNLFISLYKLISLSFPRKLMKSIVIKLSLNYLVLSTHFRCVSLDLFEITYLLKHLWYCLIKLMKTTSNLFISCYKLISISFPRKLMKSTFRSYTNNLNWFYLMWCYKNSLFISVYAINPAKCIFYPNMA